MRPLLFFVLIWYDDDEIEYEIGGRCNWLKNVTSMKESLVENYQKRDCVGYLGLSVGNM
jgi:hypothetical protein